MTFLLKITRNSFYSSFLFYNHLSYSPIDQPQRIEDPTKKETEHELEESDACESEFVQKRNEILTEVLISFFHSFTNK